MIEKSEPQRSDLRFAGPQHRGGHCKHLKCSGGIAVMYQIDIVLIEGCGRQN